MKRGQLTGEGRPPAGRGGQSLVEILIGLALIALSVGFAAILVFGGQKILIDRSNAVQARNLAKEGLEAVRSIRERNWSELTDGVHGLQFGTSTWVFSGSSDSDGFFTRKITITTEDENTKKAESEVTWNPDPARVLNVKLVTLLTNWENATPPPDPGDTGGGGLSGDWKNPRTLGTIDLGPGNAATGLDVVNKIVYMSAKASSASKPDFFVINATDGQNPVIVSSLNTGPGLNAVDKSGDYAYVANDSSNPQLQIINVSNINSPSLAATLKLPGTSMKAISVMYANSKVYIGTEKGDGPEFHIVDVSNPTAPNWLGSFEINGNVNGIYVRGNLAYIANATARELKILDVSNPASVTEIGSYDAPGESEDGKSLDVVGGKLYLGRLVGGNHVNHHEFHIIDVTNPASPQNLGSKDLAADLNSLKIRDNLAFLATGDSNREFQVWDISNPANINLWSYFNFPQVATGIDYEDNLVYVAVRSNDALRIITSSP